MDRTQVTSTAIQGFATKQHQSPLRAALAKLSDIAASEATQKPLSRTSKPDRGLRAHFRVEHRRRTNPKATSNGDIHDDCG